MPRLDPTANAAQRIGQRRHISHAVDLAGLAGGHQIGAHPTRSLTTHGKPVASASFATTPHVRSRRQHEAIGGT